VQCSESDANRLGFNFSLQFQTPPPQKKKHPRTYKLYIKSRDEFWKLYIYINARVLPTIYLFIIIIIIGFVACLLAM
jgi:hypothetical protein